MNLLRYKIFIIFILLLTTSCTISNTPFVNHEETLQLKLGMTKEMVLSIMDKPIFVKSGSYINNKDSVIVANVEWGYQVRYKTIASGTFGSPQKNGLIKGNSNPVFSLILTFEDNKLSSWKTSNDPIGRPFKPNVLSIIKKTVIIGAGVLTISRVIDEINPN